MEIPNFVDFRRIINWEISFSLKFLSLIYIYIYILVEYLFSTFNFYNEFSVKFVKKKIVENMMYYIETCIDTYERTK